MNSKVMIIVYGFIVLYFISQVECKGGSKIMKYGKAVTKRISRYTKPILMGTERTAGKLTRDVRKASRFSARSAINGMLFASRRLNGVLRFAKKRVGKKKKKGAAAAPPPPPPSAVEEPVAATVEEHHDEPAAEEHPDEPMAEEHQDEPAVEEHHDEPAVEEQHDEPKSEPTAADTSP